MNLCVIPARGGRKRIPEKNIVNVSNKPMIYWSIKTALESKCFEKIIVSTDNEEIALIAKSYGAEVPFLRPKELANDITPTQPVIKHAIEWLGKEGFNSTGMFIASGITTCTAFLIHGCPSSLLLGLIFPSVGISMLYCKLRQNRIFPPPFWSPHPAVCFNAKNSCRRRHANHALKT